MEKKMKKIMYVRPLFEEPQAEYYLKAVMRTANWLKHAKKKEQNDITWIEEPKKPDNPSLMGEFSLYSGIIGVILFNLQLAIVTKEDEYLQDAVSGGKYIIHNWNNGKDIVKDMGVEGSEYGPISGYAGVAFVMAELGKYSKDKKITLFAENLFEQISSALINSDENYTWTGQAGGISYDPGIIQYLLYGYHIFHYEKWRDNLYKAGYSLLKRAERLEKGFFRWSTITVSGIGIDDGGEMPNFFYGTAGTAYVLASLYEEFGNSEFLEAAIGGMEYIKSICTIEGKSLLTPFCNPNPEKIHFVGLCNGYSGTIRLAYKLWSITSKEEYKKLLDEMTDSVVLAGVPELHFKGYWNCMCMCCGTASLLNTFNGIYVATGENKYLDLAKRTGKYMLSQFTEIDDDSGCWYQSWRRLEPWIIDAKIGYYDGNSGEAIQLLELYTILKNEFTTIRLPDDPYPSKMKRTEEGVK